MSSGGRRLGRHDFSVDGWSTVDKVAQFSHAVGRVSGGRGSAILIALMDGNGQLVDAATSRYNHMIPTPHRLGQGASHETRSPGGEGGGAHSGRRASSNSSLEHNGRNDDAKRSGSVPKQRPLGVLLTTSHVLQTSEDTEGTTVTFLDQLSIVAAPTIGHAARPVRVALRGSYGFVSSAVPRKVPDTSDYPRAVPLDDLHGAFTMNVSTRSAPPLKRRSSLGDLPDYLLYRSDDAAAADDAVEDIGFTLTYCDIFPLPDEEPEASSPPSPSSYVPRTDGTAPAGNRADNSSPSLPARTASFQHSAGGSSYRTSRYARADGDAASCSGAGRRPNAAADTSMATATPPSRPAPHPGSLLQVQPLPVPLLFDNTPSVKVGDVHLMITHVNDGRRFYRVRNVAAVHPDFCEYEMSSANADECSGGPVFNALGDFVGIQHERRGHSVCLLMKAIVENLFESDLLGMCRSPISEVVVKTRDGLTHTGESFTAPSPSSAAAISSKVDDSTTGSATARFGSIVGTAAKSSEDGVAPFATTAAAAAKATADATAAAALASRSPAARVPSYKDVFAEFYKSPDCLSHILYAFPYCLQILKLALENLSQMKDGDELDQMSSVGGVGAILEAIDGYPQDEAIVGGALSVLCRICLYERNLAMFVQLDGIITTMEVMKEYVHLPSVLQWGTYLLSSATNVSLASSAECAEAVAQGSGPQLFVNVLRVHGALQRKSALRQMHHNRLLRWTCDVIANLLLIDPKYTTLFLHEDVMALLLQLLNDYTGNVFLTEGFVHAFCVFVQCFADLDMPTAPPSALPQLPLPAPDVMRVAPTLITPNDHALYVPGSDVPITAAAVAGGGRASPNLTSASAAARPRPSNGRQLTNTRVGLPDNGFFLTAARPSHPNNSILPSASSYTATAGTNPHRISFFFFRQVVLGDTDSTFVRSLLEICELALDPTSAATAHRGRPEKVLLRCFATLRLLLSFRLAPILLSRDAVLRSQIDPIDSFHSGELLHGLSSSAQQQQQPAPNAPSSPELTRLRAIFEKARVAMPSAYELQEQMTAVEKLLR